MSGLVAVVSLGETSRPAEELRAAALAMAGALEHRGTPRTMQVARGAVLLELGGDTASVGPEEDPGLWHVGVDGRLDDRAAVCDALGMPSREGTDARRIAAGFRRWGEEVVTHVLGDFAGVAWAEEARELVMFRDALGVRPLYFTRVDDVVLAATELHALTASGFRVPIELDRLQGARFLVEEYAEEGPTFLRGVEVVPPGSTVRFSRGRRSQRRLWTPDPFRVDQPSSPADCAARFAEVLDLAVRSRLPESGPSATLVSGGLDSSAVHGLAARARPGAPPPVLHLAFPGLRCDEARFVDAVAKKSGAELRQADPRRTPRLTAPSATRVAPGELYDLTLAMIRPLLEPEHCRPGTVILTGAGGDDLLFLTGHEAFDHLCGFRPLEAARAARATAGAGLPAARFLLGQLGRILVPPSTRALLRKIRPASRVWPSWLVPEAAQELDRWHARRMAWRQRVAAPNEVQRRLTLALLGDSDAYVFLGRLDLLAAHAGVAFRHPFYDRRVVETLLATPGPLRGAPDVTKEVLRLGLASVLPEVVRTRTDAADFSEYVNTTILGDHLQDHLDFFEHSELEASGVVRSGALAASLRRGTELALPWRAISIETALRTIRGSQASHTPARAPWLGHPRPSRPRLSR